MEHKLLSQISPQSSVLIINSKQEFLLHELKTIQCKVDELADWHELENSTNQYDAILYFDSYDVIQNSLQMMGTFESRIHKDGKIIIVLKDESYTRKKVYRLMHEKNINNPYSLENSHQLNELFEIDSMCIRIKDYCFNQSIFYYVLTIVHKENLKNEVINLLPDQTVTVDETDELFKMIEEKNQTIKQMEAEHQNLYEQFIEVNEKLVDITNKFLDLLHSKSWKLTAPLRIVMKPLRNYIENHPDCQSYIKNLKFLLKKGPIEFYRQNFQKYPGFQGGLSEMYTQKELEVQKNTSFNKEITFSILVPLYNTPEKYLHEMIQSVLDQTYGKWELCLADGSDKSHQYVEQICRTYLSKDPRIKYKKLEKNLGISGNTNECIHMATGNYISLFDHDDLLHPSALYMNMKAICDQNADFIYTDENTFHETPSDAFCPHFKPDFAPDTLRANNYICHFTSFKRSLLQKSGLFRPECDGSQDFDMMLRLTENAEKIFHIPQILYYWRAHANSVAENVGAKPYVIDAAKKAVSDHLERIGLKGEVWDSAVPSMYRLHYELQGHPLVSILIPNYENLPVLKKCIDSIYQKTTYDHYEIIIIENNSHSPELFQYYQELQSTHNNLKVVQWDGHFNYSAINNFGAQFASGDHLLLLNNDTEIITPEWIEEMLMYSQRSDVGAVGAKLYYPDDTVQHAGLGIGIKTLAGHLHRYFDRQHPGYMGRLIYAHNLSAVTFACVMIKRSVWNETSGLDEKFEVAFNDVDMCLRIRKLGYLIVWTPFAELYHYESKSRGNDDTEKKKKRFGKEVTLFQSRWADELKQGDPYLNQNFSMDHEDFRTKIK